MPKKTKDINDILFKLLSLKGLNGEKKLGIIYNYDTVSRTSVDAFGKIFTENAETIYFIDVNQTILTGEPILETFTINNKDDFKKNVKVLNTKSFSRELNETFSILFDSIAIIRDQMLTLSKALSSVKHCNVAKLVDVSEGNLIIANDQSAIAHIVFNTIKGNTAHLSPQEVEKIGNGLMEIIISNIDTDTEDENALSRIKQDIEYKIIETLPNSVKAGNINISMDSIIKEIKKIQENGFNDDEDDETNDEKEPSL
jgi:hypothetical protein